MRRMVILLRALARLRTLLQAHQLEATKRLLRLPSEYWDTAEENVETTADTTSASPVPDDKRTRRDKAVTRGLRSAGIAPAKRAGARRTRLSVKVAEGLDDLNRALTPRR